MCMFVRSFSCSNLNNLNECIQFEVKHRTDHPILFPRALSRPNFMTDHPVYYHVRIQYGHCAPATQRQTFCDKLCTAQNLKSTVANLLTYLNLPEVNIGLRVCRIKCHLSPEAFGNADFQCFFRLIILCNIESPNQEWLIEQ